MSREIIYLDDLTGERDAETVRIGWQGVWFEVDLAEANRTKLTEFIEEYINAGRPAGREEAAPEPARRTRRSRGEAGASDEKIDYLDEENFGKKHRGRSSDEEIAMIKDNPVRASHNRVTQGHEPIDWDDETEQKRYRLTDDDVAAIKAKLAS